MCTAADAVRPEASSSRIAPFHLEAASYPPRQAGRLGFDFRQGKARPPRQSSEDAIAAPQRCGTFNDSLAFQPDGSGDGSPRRIGVNARLFDGFNAATPLVEVVDGKNLWSRIQADTAKDSLLLIL